MKKSTQLVALLGLSALAVGCATQIPQNSISRVDLMPNKPAPFAIIDFKQKAIDFDKTVFDFEAQGDYWPMVWIDKSRKNFDQDVVGLYTAVGDVRQGTNNKGMFHESLATMGSVLGATLVGIDKTQGEHNYVAYLKNYFNKETGWNIMMNNTCPEVALLGGGYGRDWWYDVFPNVLFYAIYDRYPSEPGLEELARTIADQFEKADRILNGNYNYSYFDYGQMKPMTNHICPQPDAAAGHAYVLLSAYQKFGDQKYLDAARSALKALEKNTENPTYELLMPFGAYVAARLNAEYKGDFDTAKMLDWSFDGTPKCREGWGVLVGNWNGYDISGMVGSTVDRGGYGFLMNTYDMAWPIVPMVRYDQSYAVAVGKWMLNAANVSKFFYPEHIEKEHQTLPEKASVGKGVIAYEGLIKTSNMKEYEHIQAPVAQGDGPLWVPGKNPDVSQLSVYGSAHVGIFGALVEKTEVPEILRLDLLATDFFRNEAYPTYLYYNPLENSAEVTVKIGSRAVDLYDSVSGKFIQKNVKESTKIKIPAQSAVVLIHTPAGGKIVNNGSQLLVDGVVIDFHSNKE